MMKVNRFLKIATALWVVVVLTGMLWTNITVARYVAQTNLNVSVQIAEWDVEFASLFADRAVTTFRNGERIEGDITRWFTVTNNSDVTANVTLRMRVYTNPAASVTVSSPAAIIGQGAVNDLGHTQVAGITHQGGHTWQFEPGASGNFFVQLQSTAQPTPGNVDGLWYREYIVIADAVQVD